MAGQRKQNVFDGHRRLQNAILKGYQRKLRKG
ncbi:hypothetical protein [Bradyrhizobium elkanii]